MFGDAYLGVMGCWNH